MIATFRNYFPIAVLMLAVAVCVPAATVAQCPAPPATSSLAEGEIGLFFDPAGTMTCGNIYPFAPEPLYVVARVPEGGVAEFEIPQLDMLSGPASLHVHSWGLPEGSLYIAGRAFDACTRAYRPDEISCPVVQGDLLVIAQINVIAYTYDPVSGTVCFQTWCPTFAGGEAKAPAYARCDTGAWGEFTGGDSMCIGFGEAPLPVEETTWGSVKALYR